MRKAFFLLLTLVFAACASHPPAQVTQVRKPVAKPYYEAEAFVTHVMLARLMLAEPDADIEAVTPHLSVVQAYTEQTKKDDAFFQPVIIISYTAKNKKGLQRLMAPFSLSQDTAEFPNLRNILAGLKTEYTVNDVHPAVLKVGHLRALKFLNNDADSTLEHYKKVIDHEAQILLLRTSRVTPLEEAHTQLLLLQFFMAYPMRDAAYLAAENAKQSLAVAEDTQNNSAIIGTLSEQLGAQEAKLHELMPFTIGGLK
jgi:hypothetical protein